MVHARPELWFPVSQSTGSFTRSWIAMVRKREDVPGDDPAEHLDVLIVPYLR